jgi:hypothetical protein
MDLRKWSSRGCNPKLGIGPRIRLSAQAAAEVGTRAPPLRPPPTPSSRRMLVEPACRIPGTLSAMDAPSALGVANAGGADVASRRHLSVVIVAQKVGMRQRFSRGAEPSFSPIRPGFANFPPGRL